MALGLVHPQRDVTATTTKAMDNTQTPKYTQRTISISNVYGGQPLNIRFDIVLDTPVLVLPRSSCSSQVFVVHLGKISLTNSSAISDSSGGLATKIMKYDENDTKIFTIDEEVIIEEDKQAQSQFMVQESLFNHDYLSGFMIDNDSPIYETYTVDIRNINAYSLDTRNRKNVRL